MVGFLNRLDFNTLFSKRERKKKESMPKASLFSKMK